MKATIKIKKEVDVKYCVVNAEVRYWEDGTVNGVTDENGDLIPCREGEIWCPKIDIDNGVIINWKQGVTADVHYKVCDAGSYFLLDADGTEVASIQDDYVPNKLIPGDYGDYIEMQIDASGKITNWKTRPSLSDFLDRL